MNNKWISFKAGKCWGLKHTTKIEVYDNTYIPQSVLTRLLQDKKNHLPNAASDWLKIVETGTRIKKFFKIKHLPEVIAKVRPDWDDDFIQDCIDDIMSFREKPADKRQAPSEDEEYEESSESNKKHKEEEMPGWAGEFVERIEGAISQRAMHYYMCTKQFTQDCAQVCEERADSLRDEIRKRLTIKIEKELREELREGIEADIREKAVLNQNMEHLEQVARTVAMKAPMQLVTDDDIMSRVNI